MPSVRAETFFSSGCMIECLILKWIRSAKGEWLLLRVSDFEALTATTSSCSCKRKFGGYASAAVAVRVTSQRDIWPRGGFDRRE